MVSSRPGPADPGASARPATSELVLRHARPEDGAAIFSLVRAVGTLEVNSAYAYALCADHFRQTSVVAERDGHLVGFVFAYRPPIRPHSIFVWQIGVAASERRSGIASRLLAAVLTSRGGRNALFLEATVAADNVASRHLFERFAVSLRAPATWSRGYDAAHLPPDHPAEPLVSIGPLVVTHLTQELP
jgi:L-2,4-diaminobutyric acid acetyltransferase